MGFFTERILLPCAVVVFVIVYIGVSIGYYMKEIEPPGHICKIAN